MKISIIIPSKGKAPYLKKCLDSVFNLNYKTKEVIVVDDGLEREAKEVLESFKEKIKILNSNSKGPSFARNLAIRSTDSIFVAFVDCDCIVDKNWIDELLVGFNKFPSAIACGGSQCLPDDSSDFEKKIFLFMKRARFISDYNRISNDIIKVNHNPSYNVMYKRECLLNEGGFEENLWPAEDVELDYRLRKKGYTLIFNPKAVVYHYKPKNLRDFLNMMYRYGFSQGYLVKKYGIFRKIHIIPLFFIGMILIFLVLFLFKAYLYAFLFALSLLVILSFIFSLSILNIAILGFLWWNFGFLKSIMKR